MNSNLKTDLEQLPGILQQVMNLSAQYLGSIDERPVSMVPKETDWPGLPWEGIGAIETQSVFEKIFLPAIVASSGPRYWGFVTGGTTPAAIAGDWLAAIFDQNTQNTTGAGDCSALLEFQAVDLLLELFGLPPDFMGSFVSGATMANFTGLAVARQWVGVQTNMDIAREGLKAGIKVYAAAPHSSTLKAMAMLGLGSNNLVKVPVLPGREAMDIPALTRILKDSPNEPFILVASAGTVNSVDYDDFEAILALRKTYSFWLHIDAAFGAFAACSPAHKRLLHGWEHADSITIDFHKWLNVPYDNGMILTRKAHAALQMQSFQNSAAPYLSDPALQFNYLNFVPENSRRFRALPVWFTLMAYGREGYREIVEDSIALAGELADALVETGFFQLVAPVRLNTVCFGIRPDFSDRIDQDSLLNLLYTEGKVFMTPSVYHGKPCIRAAFVNYRTSSEDIGIAVQSLKTAIDKILHC